MKRLISLIMILAAGFNTINAQEHTIKLKIVQTSDIHGNFFPYDFINRKAWGGSLARVHALAEEQRKTFGENLILLDNGDILQGQPSVYYYNFIDTVSSHLCADMLNFMRYDAANMGNHDIETGHAVYDRWVKECNFPVLGANIIDTKTGAPYLPPYKIIERDGIKIAVLGLITPAIPAWLAENLWEGLQFEDMETSARKWVKIIQEKEKPDILIGLFHSGRDASKNTGKWNENASLTVAQNVPGFHIVLMGHDHRQFCQNVPNCEGNYVMAVNPGSNGNAVSDIDITITKNGNETSMNIDARLTDMNKYEPSKEFMAHFKKQYDDVDNFVKQKIGTITASLDTRPAYFGSSAFIDFIHTLQLAISGADISFAAPLSFDATIDKGDIYMSDMFNLYKYENMLYVMELTGKEIKDYLEYSYSIWTRQMTSPDDSLLLLKDITPEEDKSHAIFANPSYNFDSAAGIIYTVDVTKPQGEKISISSMDDGTPFLMDKTYKVAINSYRGNGGGELLTRGAGIPQDQLHARIVFSTDKDLRFYLMEYIRKQGTLSPKALNQWRFIPDEWVKQAAKRDYDLLFK
ncbi:MAG: 5'-nucleotidase C-terminal domain-containing protein [Muribaculaceae bacterium]|nr:5'-nucleotidase C-terminal domain-containing protein [Muribaculaceae bacterium]